MATSVNTQLASAQDYTHIPDDEFRLALTMAGAASAGCYTGGVMDYLFQILELWENVRADIEKGPNENGEFKIPELKEYWHLIPRHRVIIDAVGGTSAGGMTSVMTAIYGLNGNITPVTQPTRADEKIVSKKNNIFYDSWVVMDDLNPDDPRETAEKIWDTNDLDNNLVKSILNSSFIDSIANRCFSYGYDLSERVKVMPGYISKDLQLILSHCMLRGIPLNVSFSTPIGSVGHKSILPDHTTKEHYVVSHFHLNQGKKPGTNEYFWLNPFDGPHLEMLRIATKATGAFPAGLLYREFDNKSFTGPLLKKSIKRMITDKLGIADPDPDDTIKLKYLTNYSTASVDGGAINNEPYREVNSLLRDKYGPFPEDKFPRYGVVMIDPFPDKGRKDADYKKPYDLLEVGPAILGALVDQARVKRREVLEQDSNSSFRSIIFPRKWIGITSGSGVEMEDEEEDEENEWDEPMETVMSAERSATDPDKKRRSAPNPIACASAMAFAGLFDAKFREHDFFLGRNNARNFFRYFFSFPYDPAEPDPAKRHPIHRSWTDDMIKKFIIEKKVKRTANGKTIQTVEYFLPIIPDLTFLLEQSEDIGARRYDYDIPEMPKYDPQRLFDMQPMIAKRLLKIFNTLTKRGRMIKTLDHEQDLQTLETLNSQIEKAEAKLVKLKESPASEDMEKAIANKIARNTKLVEKRQSLQDKINGIAKTTNADAWINDRYRSGWFSRNIFAPAGNAFLWLGFVLFRKTIANKMSKTVIKKLLTDLDKGECLKQKQ